MIAQIYTKTSGDYTSVIVSNEEGVIYYHDVIEVPEITGVHRGVSFIRHNLNANETEIYPDKLKDDKIMKDVYINYCKINARIGKNPDKEVEDRCLGNLRAYIRWNSIIRKEGNVK